MKIIRAILIYLAALIWLADFGSGLVLMAIGSQGDILHSWEWTDGSIMVAAALFTPVIVVVLLFATATVHALNEITVKDKAHGSETIDAAQGADD